MLQHLGRWASPDPLQVHAGGGGEFGNSYHYVGGNLLQARDPMGLDVQFADVEGRRTTTGSGWRNGPFITMHSTAEPESSGQQQRLDRQAQQREQIVSGLRAGFANMYSNLIADARRDGASEEEIGRLQLEQRLVVASINDPEQSGGRWHLTLDTREIDRQLRGRVHWTYARLREAVESSEVVAIAGEREHQRLTMSWERGITQALPRRSGSGAPVAFSVIASRTIEDGPADIGRNVIHEIVLHAVMRLRNSSSLQRRHRSRREITNPEDDDRSAADIGSDFLKYYIRTSNESPFGPPPGRAYNPESQGAVQIISDTIQGLDEAR